MNHYEPWEFNGWYDQLSAAQKRALDIARHKWGKPIHVSNADGAVGRHLGPEDTSQHNVDRWGEVRATDIVPEGIATKADAERFVQVLIDSGFQGVGFYPHWNQGPGFHADTRVNVEEHYVAKWGRLDNREEPEYVSIAKALAEMG